MNLLDDGTTPTLTDMLDPINAAYIRLQNLIGDASEMLASAATVSARYSINDLLTYGGNLLVNITAGLSMGPILKRRTRPVTANKMISDGYNDAMTYIEQLRRGDRIFAMVPDVPEAGLMSTTTMISCIPCGGADITQVSQRYFGQGLNPGTDGRCGNPYAPWPRPCG